MEEALLDGFSRNPSDEFLDVTRQGGFRNGYSRIGGFPMRQRMVHAAGSTSGLGEGDEEENILMDEELGRMELLKEAPRPACEQHPRSDISISRPAKAKLLAYGLIYA